MATVPGLKVEKCIEWTTAIPVIPGTNADSEYFTFQGRKCSLQLYFGFKCTYDNDDDEFVDRVDVVVVKKIYRPYVSLKIISNKKLAFPFNVTAYVDTKTRSFCIARKTVNNENEDIWTNFRDQVQSYLNNSLLQLRVVLHNDIFEEKEAEAMAFGDLSEEVSDRSSDSRTNIHVEALSRDFSKLLAERSSCDVRILCEGKRFRAHRIVLETRSSFFSTMFVQNKTGSYKVQNIKASIFLMFLRYLYSGKLPELNVATANMLYEVSDKFGVEELKRACSEFLTGHSSQDNAFDVIDVLAA